MRKKTKKGVARSNTSPKKRKVYNKKKRVVKHKVPRTRNMGTLTESEYFSRIRSALRNAFKWWKPMTTALSLASRSSQDISNKRLKTEYQCNHCKKWFARKLVEIDHIEAAGSLCTYEDIIPFIKRLTVESVDSYQILCKVCHRDKTKIDNDARKLQKNSLT